jgi:MurNAc alpha-1-phosphate uridylyltransferase
MLMIDQAMVLAAGLGTRMRPLTNDRPKPMVDVGGKPLVDHMLDRLAAAGVSRAVVNVHYFADMMEGHLARRARPHVTISDERDALLETGGGMMKARPLFGDAPFFLTNTDQIWLEDGEPALEVLKRLWRDDAMDVLLLLAPRDNCLGYHGAGDFFLNGDATLAWRADAAFAPWVYAGVYIIHPRAMEGFAVEKFSAVKIWEKARLKGRLFGAPLQGYWMHVGDPQSRLEAESVLAAQPVRGA